MLASTEGTMKRFMHRSPARAPAARLLLLACLLVAACQDKRDPVKPTVSQAEAPLSVSQA
jgi:hypothetical protein